MPRNAKMGGGEQEIGQRKRRGWRLFNAWVRKGAFHPRRVKYKDFIEACPSLAPDLRQPQDGPQPWLRVSSLPHLTPRQPWGALLSPLGLLRGPVRGATGAGPPELPGLSAWAPGLGQQPLPAGEVRKKGVGAWKGDALVPLDGGGIESRKKAEGRAVLSGWASPFWLQRRGPHAGPLHWGRFPRFVALPRVF